MYDIIRYMSSSDEKPVGAESLFVPGLEIRISPPLREDDTYGGYVIVTGDVEKAAALVKAVASANDCYEGYRSKNIEREIDKSVRGNGPFSLDIDVKNNDGEIRMMRAHANHGPMQGNVDITFGGGGNRTTLEEMTYALQKAVVKLAEI